MAINLISQNYRTNYDLSPYNNRPREKKLSFGTVTVNAKKIEKNYGKVFTDCLLKMLYDLIAIKNSIPGIEGQNKHLTIGCCKNKSRFGQLMWGEGDVLFIRRTSSKVFDTPKGKVEIVGTLEHKTAFPGAALKDKNYIHGLSKTISPLLKEVLEYSDTEILLNKISRLIKKGKASFLTEKQQAIITEHQKAKTAMKKLETKRKKLERRLAHCPGDETLPKNREELIERNADLEYYDNELKPEFVKDYEDFRTKNCL